MLYLCALVLMRYRSAPCARMLFALIQHRSHRTQGALLQGAGEVEG